METTNSALYETPFKDTPVEDGHHETSTLTYERITGDVDSPFLTSYETTSDEEASPFNEEAFDLY